MKFFSVLPVLPIFIFFSVALQAQQAPSSQPIESRNEGKRPSDYLNSTLPKWLRFNGEYRTRVEGLNGLAFNSNNYDAYVLGRLRLNTAVAPTSWMRFHFQLQDSRVKGRDANPDAPPYEGTMDLRAGYVDLGNSDG